MSLLLSVLSMASSVSPSAAIIEGETSPVGEASAPRLPDSVRTMIETAIAAGDPKAVATVIAIARQANPRAAAEIDEIEQAWKARLSAEKTRAAQKREAQLAAASLFDN